MLEGHPLTARFLGSHPLATKGPEWGKGGGGSREARGPFTKRPPLHTPMAAAWVRHYPLFSHLTLQHKPIIKPSALARLPSNWCARHSHPGTAQRAHNSTYHEVLTVASSVCGNISLKGRQEQPNLQQQSAKILPTPSNLVNTFEE